MPSQTSPSTIFAGKHDPLFPEVKAEARADLLKAIGEYQTDRTEERMSALFRVLNENYDHTGLIDIGEFDMWLNGHVHQALLKLRAFQEKRNGAGASREDVYDAFLAMDAELHQVRLILENVGYPD